MMGTGKTVLEVRGLTANVAGVPILKEPFATDVCYQAHIRGPDGNTLLLHRRDDGSAG